MLLAVDIGNTNISLGVFDEKNLVEHWRVAAKVERTSDELGVLIIELFSFSKIDYQDVSAVIISSVVPPLDSAFRTMSEKYLGRTATFVDSTFDFGLKIKYEPPSSIGIDRLIVASAAIEKYGTPCVVCDFGTATTIDAVTSNREFLGGIIAPGMNTMSESLFTKTSKLPQVKIEKLARVIGNSTAEAIQSGIYFGYLGLVDGIIERMTGELGEKPKVVATGGFADLIAEGCARIDVVDANLLLEGLRRIYEKRFR